MLAYCIFILMSHGGERFDTHKKISTDSLISNHTAGDEPRTGGFVFSDKMKNINKCSSKPL